MFVGLISGSRAWNSPQGEGKILGERENTDFGIWTVICHKKVKSKNVNKDKSTNISQVQKL